MYTTFIHTDDDLLTSGQLPRPMLPRRSSTFGRNSKEPADPYSLLLEGRLDTIRPDLDCLSFEDPYSYLPLESKENFLALRKGFEDGKSLQLISQRSRPGAYAQNDPNSSGPGVVDIKVVKAGFLLKLEGKRKNRWSEWGIILTASQLYFFKDTAWFRNNIMNQQSSTNSRDRAASDPRPSEELATSEEEECSIEVIRPLIDGFHPHAVMSTTGMVALFSQEDAPKNRHSFMLGYKGGTTEWFSCSKEPELLDWMLKINFASSFNTFYVVGINPNPRRPPRKLRTLRRINSDSSTSTMYSSSTTTTVRAERAAARAQEFSEVHFARKFNVGVKLEDIKKKLKDIDSQLDDHIRNGRGLKLLAPIQPRTREAVFLSAARLTATLRWKWLERRKLLCYKEYFEMDLVVENEICSTLAPLGRVETASPAMSSSDLEVDETSSVEIQSIAEMQEDVTQQALVRADLGHERKPSEVSQHTVTQPDGLESVSDDRSSVTQSVRSESSQTESVVGEEAKIKIPKRAMSQSRMHTRSHSQSIGRASSKGHSITHVRSKSQTFSKGLSDGEDGLSITVGKRMPLTLRAPSMKRKGKEDPQNGGGLGTQRSVSLIRKEGEKITLYGKKFHVVEVNPDLAASPSHQRTLSQTLSGASSSYSGGVREKSSKESCKEGDEQAVAEGEAQPHGTRKDEESSKVLDHCKQQNEEKLGGTFV